MRLTSILLTLSLLFLAALPIYIFWPFSLEIHVRTGTGRAIDANLTVFHTVGPIAGIATDSDQGFSLWKGRYILQVEAAGFEPQSFEVSNPLAFRQNRDFNLTITLNPIIIPLARFDFRDPTRTIKIFPWLEFNGTAVSGEVIKANLSLTSSVPYGEYTVRAADPHFNGTFQFSRDRFQENRLDLEPNSLFEQYSPQDASYMHAFLADYTRLLNGLPKQFFLSTSRQHISLGDMLAIQCQEAAARRGRAHLRSYFLLRNHTYSLGGEEDCYSSSLGSMIPRGTLLDLGIHFPRENISLGVTPLNSRTERFSLALSFDVESGRYIQTKTENAIGPCHNATTRLGLSPENLICNAPAIVPWSTPLDGPHSGDLPYPWATGREGLDAIFRLPERYGFPITTYWVTRDLIVLEALDASLHNRTQRLVDSGLVEIGVHGWLHSAAGSRPILEEEKDLSRSKAFLQDSFGTNVTGMRAPHFGLLRNNPVTHDDLIRQIGLTYYSGLPDQVSAHNIPVAHFLEGGSSVSTNLTIMPPKEPVVIIAHPWDFSHRQIAKEGETFLVKDPSLHDQQLAKILYLVSEGATVKRLDQFSQERFG